MSTDTASSIGPGPDENLAADEAKPETPPPADSRVVWLLFAAATVFGSVVAMLHNRATFSHRVFEDGDAGINSLLVNRAEHLHQFVGNYSRVGFHHPGPAFFWVLAAGQGIFYDLLHVVPGQFNGQQLGQMVFTSICLALVTVIFFRMTRSLPAALLTFGILYFAAAQSSMFANAWFPYLYMPAFLLFVAAGSCLAAGNTGELPLYIIGSSFLVHGHVSFLLFVGITTPVVVLAWLRVHRHRVRDELAAHRAAWIGGLVALAIFLAPLVIEIVLHFPGPWHQYYVYTTRGSDNAPRSLGDAFHFAGWYLKHGHFALWVVVLAVVVGVALTILDRAPGRRRLFASWWLMLALQSCLFGYYVFRGVDALTVGNRYVGFFYFTVPMLAVALAGTQVVLAVQSIGDLDRVPYRLGLLAITAAAMVILLSVGAGARELRAPGTVGTGYPQAVSALRNAPGRNGARVAILITDGAVWPEVAGIAIQAERTGLPWCIVPSNPDWVNLFTPTYTCSTTVGAYQVGAGQPSAPVQPGSQVLVSTSQFALFTLPT